LTGWDRGIPYTYAWSKLTSIYRRSKGLDRCYAAIALVQLRNGLRASEAVRALAEYIQSKRLEFELQPAKKKRRDPRLVVIPDLLAGEDLAYCLDTLQEGGLRRATDRYRKWLQRHTGWNTHSLRYSFITHLLEHGVNPAIIAKITKHSRLDYILTYTQEKLARRILEEL